MDRSYRHLITQEQAAALLPFLDGREPIVLKPAQQAVYDRVFSDANRWLRHPKKLQSSLEKTVDEIAAMEPVDALTLYYAILVTRNLSVVSVLHSTLGHRIIDYINQAKDVRNVQPPAT